MNPENPASADRNIGTTPLSVLFNQAIERSVQYAVPALLIAVTSAVGFFSIDSVGELFGLPDKQIYFVLSIYFVVAHAYFIGFLSAFLALPTLRTSERRRRSLWFGARATPSIALLMVPALILAIQAPRLAPVLWTFATFFALPSHFVRFGWSAWLRPPGGFTMPAAHRAALLLPSLLFLSLLTFILPLHGRSWGIMEGGWFFIPMSLIDIFCANYLCALFSSEFTGPLAASRGAKSAP